MGSNVIIEKLRGALTLRHVVIAVLILAFIPLWLPNAVGGKTYYHYVVSKSMTGSVDKGSLVAIWPQEDYQIGDVVAFQQGFGLDFKVPILHRIIGKDDVNSFYLIKGDATDGVDRVPRKDIIGKMAFAVPYLGYFTGAAKFFPVLIGFMVMSPFLSGRKKVILNGTRREEPVSYFVPVAITVILALPFATIGLVEQVGRPMAFTMVVGLLLSSRAIEVTFKKELGGFAEILYSTVLLATLSMVYIPELVPTLKGIFGL